MLPHGIWVGLCTISLYTSLLNFEIPTILWSNQLLQQEHYRAFNIEENFHISAQICQIFSVYCHWPCDLWHFALINAIKSLSMRSYCTFISSGNDSIEFMLLCDISVLYSSKETLDSRWLVHVLVCEDKTHDLEFDWDTSRWHTKLFVNIAPLLHKFCYHTSKLLLIWTT